MVKRIWPPPSSEARHRPAAEVATILVNARGRDYTRSGIDSIMDRLTERVGFRVHAHGFRHTFAAIGANFRVPQE